MIVYEPSKFLARIAPRRKIEKLLSSKLTIKRTALEFAAQLDFLDEKAIARVALKTIRGYKERVKADPDLKSDILDDPKQLIQSVENEVITQISGEIKDRYAGEFYKWLPSDADEPDPEHQLNYGETFQIGDGEQPGDRFGCRCGMQILVDDSSLELQ